MIKVSDYYKKLFGRKIYKIAVDAGCTCPNRDGTKAYGGCIFCSQNGSGDFVPEKSLSVVEQVREAKKKVLSKNKEGGFIVYFQNFTNTYGNIENLFQKWKEASECEEVVGVAIGTRPDCIDLKTVEKLKVLSENTFVTVELGLQTSNEETGRLINRCYTDEDFLHAVKLLKDSCPEVHLVCHLIFGLPGETEEDMMNSVDFAVSSGIDGIKFSVLYVLKGTVIESMYSSGKFKVMEEDEYFHVLEKALKRLASEMVVHRMTGDGPKNLLVAPEWTKNKKKILSRINQLLVELK